MHVFPDFFSSKTDQLEQDLTTTWTVEHQVTDFVADIRSRKFMVYCAKIAFKWGAILTNTKIGVIMTPKSVSL